MSCPAVFAQALSFEKSDLVGFGFTVFFPSLFCGTSLPREVGEPSLLLVSLPFLPVAHSHVAVPSFFQLFVRERI